LRSAWCRIAVATPETTTLTGRTITVETAFGTRCTLGYGDGFTINDQIGCRDLAATIHQREFEWLSFCQTRKSGLLNSADVHEHIVGTVIHLDEAETLLAIEKFDYSFAGANDLRGHWWSTSGTTGSAEAAAATCAAAESATRTSAAKITLEWRGCAVAIIAVIPETVSFVPATAVTLAIKTHVFVLAFSPPKTN
jgi:hypothetical protein